MGKYVAESLIKNIIKAGANVKDARVAIMGFTFKENCPDTRNTKVIDIYNELKEYSIDPIVIDPEADADEALRLYGIKFSDMDDAHDLDAVIFAVSHAVFTKLTKDEIGKMYASGNAHRVLLDVKGIFDRKEYEDAGYIYWRL